MDIKAKITGIKYTTKLISNLKEFRFSNDIEFYKKFNINDLPPCCLINYDGFIFGLSKWVSPKRTRSYPYARVYNTLGTSKRVTVIPIIKDEGKDGDRDFIQWDTVSLMSLLDVFVVFAYYNNAEKNNIKPNKITNQRFDNQYIINKIYEIRSYHSSALHWNLNEIKNSFHDLIQKTRDAYSTIGEQLNIEFHNEDGIDKFYKQFIKGIDEFMRSSRQKAQEAQNREKQTTQPKEFLETTTKGTITIENYLGGKYYFTVDELDIKGNEIYLIESKHSQNSIIPSIGDIKDGLLKMILYTNLKEVIVDGKQYKPVTILKLTSSILKQKINQYNLEISNEFKDKQKDFLKKLFEEAKENNFQVLIESVEKK